MIIEHFGLERAVLSTGPRLNTARGLSAAVKIGGRLFVFGGFDGKTSFSSTEVLELDTMMFKSGPAMLSMRQACCAIALDARRVLVLGGCENATSEILDAETLTFTKGPTMISPRTTCAIVALDANRVLVLSSA